MKKPHLFIAILLLLTQASRAQDLSSYIPKDATAVATFKSAELFELISLEQFNNSTLGKSISKALQGKNIEEVGLDLRQDFYYFMLETDSTTTHGILLPMANEGEVLATLQRQLGLGTNSVQHLGDVPYLRSVSGKDLYTWKNNCLAILATDIKHGYFWGDSVANRYGIERYSPYDESDYTHKVDSIADSLDYGQDALANDVVDENPSETWGNYDDYYQKEDSIKGVLKVKWGIDKVQEWYSLSAKDALQTDPAFQKSKRKDALASLWVNSVSRIYQGSVPPLYPYHTFNYAQRGIPGVQGAEAHFLCDEREAKITVKIGLSPTAAGSFKKIYDRRINRKLLRYAPLQNAVSVVSLSFNTKEYLQQLPVLMSNFYAGLVGLYDEEVELATDFVSLLLDEEAIGNVALGDGLLWVNGVEDVEKTYKTYEYDDNFEYREVEKTKTEKQPDFTLLFSSKDQKIFHKLLAYGQYKGKVEEEEPHVFRLKDRNSPMDIFITTRKGMIAMGSSKTDIQHIATGKKIGNASKKQKQLIRKNKFAFLVNSAQSKEILWEELALNKQNEALNTFIQQVSDVQMTSEGIKDNSLVGEISMDVPHGSSNGLTYLLDLIGGIATTM